jgi:hypothetical protein
MGTMEVTSRLRKRIERDFGESGDSQEVCRLVGEASDTERVQAAIVLTAGGRLADLHDAMALAQIDWRDVLMNAGLANEDWPTRLDEHLGPTTT